MVIAFCSRRPVWPQRRVIGHPLDPKTKDFFMSVRNNKKNAMVHGVYAKDIILPWESREDFEELVRAQREFFQPKTVAEDNLVFEIAVLEWRKRRAMKAGQKKILERHSVEVEQSDAGAGAVEKAEQHAKFKGAVVRLSDGITSVATTLRGGNMGKLGANVRGVVGDLEVLMPVIKAGLQADAAAISDAELLQHNGDLRSLAVEERFDALIGKKVKRLVFMREYQRQYCEGSSPKVIEDRSKFARDVTPVLTSLSPGPSPKKADDPNDDWENDNDNDNADEYDSAEEYDADMAEKARLQMKRLAKKA
jgi:hypothetical protein